MSLDPKSLLNHIRNVVKHCVDRGRAEFTTFNLAAILALPPCLFLSTLSQIVGDIFSMKMNDFESQKLSVTVGQTQTRTESVLPLR
jgi:hypothetical protein